MRYKIINKSVLRFLGNKLTVPLVNVLCKTLRINEDNNLPINSLFENNKNMIFAFWHGTMLVPWFRLKNYSPSTIISQSKDGDILVRILENWKYTIKRGSSSKDGKEILRELVSEANEGKSITITPDGPRGPEKKMKAGAVIIAKKAQIPLILVGVGNSRKIKLNSWDKFEIPFFFSKVNIIYSDPIYIYEKLTYDETDTMIMTLSNKLNELQNKAEQN